MTLISQFTKEVKDLARYRWVIYMSVLTTLKMRYRRSALGFFWSLLGPALNYGTLAVVFYFGMKPSGSSNYFMYVFPGILCFSFMAATFNNSSLTFIVNETFLKKIYLPKSIFVVNTALSELVNFLLNMVAMIIVTALLGVYQSSWEIILLPLFIIIFLFFVFGLGLIISIGTVFFRDLQHVVPIFIQALFYLTPVLYFPEIMPKQFQFITEFNPLYQFILLFRGLFYDTTILTVELFLKCLVLSIASFLLGLWCLKINDNKIVFRL